MSGLVKWSKDVFGIAKDNAHQAAIDTAINMLYDWLNEQIDMGKKTVPFTINADISILHDEKEGDIKVDNAILMVQFQGFYREGIRKIVVHLEKDKHMVEFNEDGKKFPVKTMFE